MDVNVDRIASSRPAPPWMTTKEMSGLALAAIATGCLCTAVRGTSTSTPATSSAARTVATGCSGPDMPSTSTTRTGTTTTSAAAAAAVMTTATTAVHLVNTATAVTDIDCNIVICPRRYKLYDWQTGRKGRAFRRGASVGRSNQKRVLTTSKGINCRDVLHNAAPYLTRHKVSSSS